MAATRGAHTVKPGEAVQRKKQHEDEKIKNKKKEARTPAGAGGRKRASPRQPLPGGPQADCLRPQHVRRQLAQLSDLSAEVRRHSELGVRGLGLCDNLEDLRLAVVEYLSDVGVTSPHHRSPTEER